MTIEETIQDLMSRGYKRIDHKRLPVGARVRNRGEQYHAALWKGTAVVEAVLRNEGSSWERRYGAPDIEVVVTRDDGTVGQWANYGTVVAFDWADAQAVKP